MINWGLILGIIQLSLTVITLTCGIYAYIKITGNDLKHLSVDVKNSYKKVELLQEKTEQVCNRITAIEIRCQERYKDK